MCDLHFPSQVPWNMIRCFRKGTGSCHSDCMHVLPVQVEVGRNQEITHFTSNKRLIQVDSSACSGPVLIHQQNWNGAVIATVFTSKDLQRLQIKNFCQDIMVKTAVPSAAGCLFVEVIVVILIEDRPVAIRIMSKCFVRVY